MQYKESSRNKNSIVDCSNTKSATGFNEGFYEDKTRGMPVKIYFKKFINSKFNLILILTFLPNSITGISNV